MASTKSLFDLVLVGDVERDDQLPTRNSSSQPSQPSVSSGFPLKGSPSGQLLRLQQSKLQHQPLGILDETLQCLFQVRSHVSDPSHPSSRAIQHHHPLSNQLGAQVKTGPTSLLSTIEADSSSFTPSSSSLLVRTGTTDGSQQAPALATLHTTFGQRDHLPPPHVVSTKTNQTLRQVFAQSLAVDSIASAQPNNNHHQRSQQQQAANQPQPHPDVTARNALRDLMEEIEQIPLTKAHSSSENDITGNSNQIESLAGYLQNKYLTNLLLKLPSTAFVQLARKKAGQKVQSFKTRTLGSGLNVSGAPSPLPPLVDRVPDSATPFSSSDGLVKGQPNATLQEPNVISKPSKASAPPPPLPGPPSKTRPNQSEH